MAQGIRFTDKANVSAGTIVETGTGKNSATGDSFVMMIADAQATVTPSDTIDGSPSGNTWTRVGTQLTVGVIRMNMWRCENGNGGTNHRFKVTGGGNMDAALFVYCLSGMAAASFDKTAQGTDATSPYGDALSTGTLSQANEIAIAFYATDGGAGSIAASGGYTDGPQEANAILYWPAASAYQLVGATTALAASFTNSAASSVHGVIMATFKEATGGGSSTSIAPSKAALTLFGRASSMNAFSTVTIRETLINEAGSPVSNRTGMSLVVWYAGSPVGAHDLSYSALTTDANGTLSWNIEPGTLIYGQAVFFVATDGGASLSQYTCARVVPIYQ